MLSRVPGLVALLAAAACALAGLAPTLGPGADAPPGAAVLAGPAFSMSGGALLVPAAVALGLPGLVVLLGSPRLVARGRPALSVAWLAVLFAGGPALDVVLGALRGGAPLAVGGWAVVAALVLAPLTALAALIAGVAERRDVGGVTGSGHSDDTPDRRPREPDPRMLPLAAVAAVLAVPGFGGPLVRSALSSVDGAWQDPGAASWGALAGLLGVAVAVLLAPRARPPRALGLLGGAAAVLAVRLCALLLTPPRPGEHVGAGTWAAAACLVAVLAAGAVAVHRVRDGFASRADTERLVVLRGRG